MSAKKKTPFEWIEKLDVQYSEKRDALTQAISISTGKNLVTLTVGQLEFAVEVGLVIETVRYSPPHALPRSFDWVLGVIDLRGEVIPVIDFSAFNGQGQTKINHQSRMIIIKHDDFHYALLVSGVSPVRLVAEDTIFKLKKENKPKGTKIPFKEAVLIDNQQKMYLDINSLSNDKELTQLTF
ncbi:MAG: hypothetical protein A6F71_03320 [Cycloclasticus sp. symbiont of Poecilosclerida sp. M]|nr:MAG: hypothetical protein A6F71_03320 [Cycloclasticus sp. symbiont of Poecilosclerida sp. M]